jgi:hypothetical protein
MKNDETSRVERQPRNRASKTQWWPCASTLGQHQDDAPLLHSYFILLHFRGRGRQVMHLPCKQVDGGAIPPDSTSFAGRMRFRRGSEAHLRGCDPRSFGK